MSEPVRVDVGACRCPGSPHASDWVLLRPALTVPMGAAAMAAIRATPGTQAEQEGAIAEVFLHMGIVGWSFVGPALVPEEVTPANIDRLLPWGQGGFEVSNRAADLYGGDLFAPFVATLATPSPPGPTDGSTSASPPSSSSPPRRQRRSSPNGTAGRASEVPVL